MPIEYERVRGGLGVDYVMTHNPEQWQMLIAGQWYPHSYWRNTIIRVFYVYTLEFRRQVSSEFSL